jgi:hypothetical protein
MKTLFINENLEENILLNKILNKSNKILNFIQDLEGEEIEKYAEWEGESSGYEVEYDGYIPEEFFEDIVFAVTPYYSEKVNQEDILSWIN